MSNVLITWYISTHIVYVIHSFIMAYSNLSLILTFCSVCIVYVPLINGQLNWTDCVPDEFADPIFVHSLVVSPLPIRLPGEYNVSFDAVVSSYVNELVIDTEIGWRNLSTGDMEKVYPSQEDTALRVFDACYVINKMLFSDPDVIGNDLDVQIDKLLVGALNYHAGCPLLVGRITFTSQLMRLPVDVIEMNALRKDRYAIKIVFRTKTNKYLGCVQFHALYDGQVMN